MFGLICDQDGTLIDSEPLHVRLEQAICREFGLVVPADEWHEFVGLPMRDIFRTCLTKYGKRTSDLEEIVTHMVAEKRIRFIDMAAHVTLMHGALDFLQAARAGFKHMGLATSSGKNMSQKMFDQFSLHRYFDVAVTLDDVSKPKPDPEPYVLAAKQMGLSPSHCYALEDSAAGVRSARSAGCWVIGLIGTLDEASLIEAGARNTVESLTEARLFLGV